jgi:hypothetical protein
VFNKQFVGLEDQGDKVTAVSDTVGNSQTFQIIRNNDDRNRVRLQASNGQFIQVLLNIFFFNNRTVNFTSIVIWALELYLD